MRFDVSLVSVLLGSAQAANIARPRHAGWGQDRQFGGKNALLELQEEIRRLEGKLAHDWEEVERKQQWQHHRPGPQGQWGGWQSSSMTSESPTSTPAGESTASAPSTLTSAISAPSVGTISYFTSAANTSAALQSLSSVASSLSDAISSVSSVNATLTASPSPSTPGTAGSDTIVTVTVSSTSYSTTEVYTTCTESSDSGATQTGSGASELSSASSAYSSPTGAYGSSASASQTPVVGSASGQESVSSTVAAASSLYPAGESSVSAISTISVPYGNGSATVISGTGASGYLPSSALPSSSKSFFTGTAISSYSVSSKVSSSSIVSYNATSLPITGTAVSSYSVSSKVSSSPIASYNATSAPATGTGVSSSPLGISSSPIVSYNATSLPITGTAVSSSSALSTAPIYPAGNSSAILATGTVSMAPTNTSVANAASSSAAVDCSSLCASLTLDTEYNTVPVSCEAISANTEYTFTGGQATAQCGSTSTSSFTPAVDICRVTLSITTSGESETYMEVWLPNNGTDAWNGRVLSTDNGGANGCVHYVDMQYVSSLGFAAIGDNGGHNSSAFDAGWMYFHNEEILDWVYRARHASVAAGKQVVDQFYGTKPSYSYYLGCSTGGQQGLHSAQHYPDDFDGIIAGSAAADFNHLQGWSGRFVQLTGTNSSDPRFLTEDQWILVQSYILNQCDAPLDGVADGILEDPTICQFDASAIQVCEGASNSTCLTSTQINTVEQVFTELYNTEGELLYPSLLYGSQVDAFRLGQLSGSVQAIASDWYGGGVWNNSYYDALNMNQTDYAEADSENDLHGDVASFSGDLSAFQAAGKKLLVYHGLADPLVSGSNSQRYYLKVAQTLGLSNDQLDPFFRYFRISGMAHCGVGGISGAGAWMFGQSGAAAVEGVNDNVIWDMVDWVENGNAPDVLTGTKFYYDTASLGVDFRRNHCRFPYRTTYSGSGDSADPANWSCVYIEDWQDCGVGAHPRLCNADGTFT